MLLDSFPSFACFWPFCVHLSLVFAVFPWGWSESSHWDLLPSFWGEGTFCKMPCTLRKFSLSQYEKAAAADPFLVPFTFAELDPAVVICLKSNDWILICSNFYCKTSYPNNGFCTPATRTVLSPLWHVPFSHILVLINFWLWQPSDHHLVLGSLWAN